MCGNALCGVLVCFAVLPPAGAAKAEAETTRIISMVPSVTEFLYALEADNQIVADSDYCNFPVGATSKPKVGGLLNPNIERIIALRPTSVVILDSQDELAGKLRAVGIGVRRVKTDSLEEAYASMRTAAGIAGRVMAGERIIRGIQGVLEAIRERHLKQNRTAIIIVGRQPNALQNMYAAGIHTYLGELLEIAGARNVAPESTHPYGPVSKEQLLRADPELIIDTSLGEAGRNESVVESHRKVWETLPSLRAVRAGRIRYVTDPHFTIPGPGIAETAGKMESLIWDETTPTLGSRREK